MNLNSGNVDVLLADYETLVHEAKNGKSELGEGDWYRLQSLLSDQADWTDKGAAHLVWLVRKYGAFMLRNALALSIAAGIEDGHSAI